MTLRLGDEVPKGKKAKTGLYAILDRRKDKILRVALSREIAETLCDYKSRYVREAFLSKVEPCPTNTPDAPSSFTTADYETIGNSDALESCAVPDAPTPETNARSTL